MPSSRVFPNLIESSKLVLHPDTSHISDATQQYIYRLITDSTVVRYKSTSGRRTVINFDTDQRDGTIFYANMRGKPRWQIAVVWRFAKDEQTMALTSRQLEEKKQEQKRIGIELHIANSIQQARRMASSKTLPTPSGSNCTAHM